MLLALAGEPLYRPPLERPMLWAVQLEGPETSNGYTVRRVQSLLVRWRSREGKIGLVATDKDRATGRFRDRVVHAFPSADGTVDLSPILNGEVAEMSPAWALAAPAPKDARVERLDRSTDGFEARVRPTFGATPAVVLHSLVALPDPPLPRLAPDPRVGTINAEGPDGSSVCRFRPDRRVVFGIAPEVPKRWRPFLRAAVRDWRDALASAGWRNALDCRDAPESDPAWNPADSRRSVIRWSEGSVENATGYAVTDPRTGETLSGKVVVGAHAIDLFCRLYAVQAWAADPRARRWPLPFDLQGRLLRYTVGHEIGHVLGLDHNALASSVYTVAQLRTKGHPLVASIMSYGRFNYVAEAADHAATIPAIGPYDRWALRFLVSGRVPPNQGPETFVAEPGNPVSTDPDAQWEKLGRETLLASERGIAHLWPVHRPELAASVAGQWAT